MITPFVGFALWALACWVLAWLTALPSEDPPAEIEPPDVAPETLQAALRREEYEARPCNLRLARWVR